MSERMLAWLRTAIQLEQDGLDFYLKCQHEVKNARALELFEFLIKVETGHKRVLTEIFNAATKGDKNLIERSVDAFMKLDTHHPLFDKDSLKKITSHTANLHEMFNKAMQFEDKGIRFYSDHAETEKDPKVKELLLRLAADERLHRADIKNLGYFVFGVPPPDDYI